MASSLSALRPIGMTKQSPRLPLTSENLPCVCLSSGQAGNLRFNPVMISRRILFAGSVQGVGFRWSVKQVAKGFDVVGWVRNLPDGRVELLAGGEEAEVSAFVAAIGESELRAHIREQTEFVVEEPPPARGFEIRHD